MEENEIGAYEYLSMIWRRRILIVAVTLACIVIGVVMSFTIPAVYRAEALIRIGIVGVTNMRGDTTIAVPTLIDTTENLTTTIPIEYSGFLAPGYAIKTGAIKKTPFLNVMVEGPEGGKAKEFLTEVLRAFTKDHGRVRSELLDSYRVLARGLNESIRDVDGDLRKKSTEVTSDVFAGNVRELFRRIESLLNLKRETEYNMFINNITATETKMIGSIRLRADILAPKRIKCVLTSSIAGLTISFLLVFFIEYLIMKREEGKKLI